MRKLKALALTVVAAVTLTGCVQLTADLEINRSDRVSGEVTAAVSKDLINQLRMAGLGEFVPDVDENLFSPESGVTETEVTNSTWEGTRFSFDNRDLSLLNLSDGNNPESYLRVYRDGDYLITEGRVVNQEGVDQADLPASVPDPDVALRISYPGVVESTNGQQLGSTVEWRLEPGEDLVMEARVLSQFVESNEQPGPPLVVSDDYLDEVLNQVGEPLLRFFSPLLTFLAIWGGLSVVVIIFSVVRHSRKPGQYRPPEEFGSLNKDLFDKDKDE